MVIISIFGGLGNQMFQYALGRNLSVLLKTDLKFDYSINKIRTDFNPDDILSIFDIFKVKGEMATPSDISKFRANSKFIKLYFCAKHRYPCLFRNQYRLILESNFHFDKDILSLPDNCYLHGHWQSEKYFQENEKLIREDFKIILPLDGQNLKIADAIKNSDSISIHLRGRDFISQKKTSEKHFTCDTLYYQRGIRFVSDRIRNPHFFVFSDDPAWAKSYLPIRDVCTFVEGNSWNKTGYEDLRLMTMCKHNIIANSSFSWWGAWLNPSPHKIVVAPKSWFNDTSINTNDIIPSNWTRI